MVPVQAIAEHKGEFFAFVDHPPVIERRKVKVGDTNEKMVQVLDGLKEGERVTLDARSRAVAEFKLDESSRRRTSRRPTPRTWPRSPHAEPLKMPVRSYLLPAGEARRYGRMRVTGFPWPRPRRDVDRDARPSSGPSAPSPGEKGVGIGFNAAVSRENLHPAGVPQL